MTLEEENAALKAENARLREGYEQAREHLALWVARVQELEARLAKGRLTGGKPPSSDGLARKTESLRRCNGKQPGRQLGHRGETLRRLATPDAVVEHRPVVCAQRHTPLDAVDDAAVVLRERRQVQELPRVRLTVTEHQALHVRCPACQAVSVGALPAEAPSRAQYGPRLRALAVYLVEQQFVPYGRVRELFADRFGAALSLGTLLHPAQQRAVTLAPVEVRRKAALQQAPVLHVDFA
jgi:transposase